MNPCKNCKYFNACGDEERTMPCSGRSEKPTIDLPDIIYPGDVQSLAEKYMDASEISHWCSDLYLKVTPISEEIVKRLKWTALLETFIDNIEGKLWYDFPFCYHEKR